MSTLLGLSAVVALLMLPSATADCNAPAWTPLTSIPMLNLNGDPIVTSPNSKVSTIDLATGFDGMKYITSDHITGVSSMGTYTPGSANWAVASGFNMTFTDFTLIKYLNTMCLIYIIQNNNLWIVEQDLDTNEWSNNRQIYSSDYGLRSPQAALLHRDLWISVENPSVYSVYLISSTDGLATFNVIGDVAVDGNQLMPDENWAVFAGTVDGGETEELWFYWIDYTTQTPRISYVTDYGSPNPQLAPSQTLSSAVPFTSTKSVSAMVSPTLDVQQAILLRTGPTTNSTQSVVAFTVIKLSSVVAEYCDEALVKWSSTLPPAPVLTNLSPALTSNPTTSFSGNVVALTWVSSVDGTLNTVVGSPWE